MPSESIAGFLDRAQASRVLFPEQVEQLIRQPDIPQCDLNALCEYLLSRGVLTRFQADAIREARGQELSVGGYPVIDAIGPCPGGTAYRALHPSLRTPLVLRRIRPDWLSPADGPASYIARARACGPILHPNLVHLVDAGVYHDEVYAVIEQPADAIDLEALSMEVGGAMPAFLAAEYGRAIASGLRVAHERGATHGDVRPANLLVGPLAVKTAADGQVRRRPAPEAVVRLAELGLVPVRPPAAAHPAALTAYLPPERIDAGACHPRGDIYGLGATLYFLLAGRAPFWGDGPDELATKIRSAAPPSLAALRPDLPADFVALVGKMIEKSPDCRPATIAEVESALATFCRPGTAPAMPEVVPMASPASSAVKYPVVQATPVTVLSAADEPEPEQADPWGVGSAALADAHADADRAPRKRRMSARDKGRTRMLVIFGALLHITWIGLLVAYLTGAFDRSTPPVDTSPEPKPTPKPRDRDRDDPPPKKKTFERNTPTPEHEPTRKRDNKDEPLPKKKPSRPATE
jgi:serine/threonine protein kinase